MWIWKALHSLLIVDQWKVKTWVRRMNWVKHYLKQGLVGGRIEKKRKDELRSERMRWDGRWNENW